MSPLENHDDDPRVLRALLLRFGVDRAVFFAVSLRAWQFLGGAVSTMLIALFFSVQQQGYYYVFVNVLALQTFFELGLSVVIVNVASHEWSRLRLGDEGEIAGAPDARSRLFSLGRMVFRWYAVAAVCFVLIVGAVGVWFFSQRPETGVAWRWPWCSLALSTGLMLWTLPFNALLEGCHRVASVNRFRLIQAIVGNFVVWTLLASGAGLWAVAISSWARLACELVFLLIGYRRFFAPFWSRPTGPEVDWRAELWPMQWRLAISGVFHYFALNLFGPVMFWYHDAATAGRMGMTWTLASVTQAAALAWVQTKAPTMGRLIAKREFAELDRLFYRTAAQSVSAMGLGALAVWLGIAALGNWWPRFAERLLDPTSAGLLMLGFVFAHFPHCQAFYVRAHKYDNLLVVNVFSSLLTAGLVWLLGSKYGPVGAVSAYLGVAAFALLPLHTWMWLRCRNRR